MKAQRLGVAILSCIMVASSLFAQGTPPRGIIPFVGSTAGANGAVFSMGLTLYGHPGMRGLIYFRPAGHVASFADRSLPYVFLANSAAGPGDIVTAGAGDVVHFLICRNTPSCNGGIGSLEIIPDANYEQTVPVAVTHLFIANSTLPGGVGGYGTMVPQIDPDQWLQLQSEPGASRTMYIPDSNSNLFRTNVGFRTLTDVSLSIYTRDVLTGISAPTHRTLPANFTLLESLEQFVSRRANFGDVWVTIDSGSAISFYTYTNNSTNEPTLVVAQPTSHTVFPSIEIPQN